MVFKIVTKAAILLLVIAQGQGDIDNILSDPEPLVEEDVVEEPVVAEEDDGICRIYAHFSKKVDSCCF